MTKIMTKKKGTRYLALTSLCRDFTEKLYCEKCLKNRSY